MSESEPRNTVGYWGLDGEYHRPFCGSGKEIEVPTRLRIFNHVTTDICDITSNHTLRILWPKIGVRVSCRLEQQAFEIINYGGHFL